MRKGKGKNVGKGWGEASKGKGKGQYSMKGSGKTKGCFICGGDHFAHMSEKDEQERQQ